MKVSEIYDKCRKAKNNNQEIIIYGAGLAAHLIYDRLIHKLDVCCDYFCTSFEPEHIDRLTKRTVLNRKSLELHNQALIIVALGITFSNKTYEEIKEYVINAGVSEENIIIDTHEWIVNEAKPYSDKDGNINLYTLSYHVTKQCNLKCKMCGQLLFGPVERRSFPSEQIIHDADMVFNLVNHIDILKLIGGEVFTYAKLGELIEYLRKYRDKIGLLEIYTNGTIFPKTEVLDAIRNYDGEKQITISDYGELSTARDMWIDWGGKNGIFVNVLGFASDGKSGYKGWIDCTEISDLKESEEEIISKYISCGQRLDYVLEDSILATCTSFHMLNYALKKELKRNECVYINDEISIEEKKKKVLELGLDTKYLDVCKYCIWGSNIRDKLPRYPAAEQIE